MMTDDRKKIVVLATGGTIAGTGRSGSTMEYHAGGLDISALISETQNISDLAWIIPEQFCNIDSCDMTTSKWIKLAKHINEIARDEEIDGIVVTHGTDTLEETAYFLNLTVKTSKPIILTGSMRPSTALSADGPLNLYQAVSLACSEEAIGKGVMVVFSEGIYSARDVQKSHCFNASAFSQKDLGCMGYMRDQLAVFYNQSIKKHTVETEFDIDKVKELPNVKIAYFYADASEEILDYLAKDSDGIVICGAGCGMFSERWANKIKGIINMGIPVVRTTRVCNGAIINDGVPYDLHEIISGDTLPAQNARVLLALALTKTYDTKEIQAMFEKY